MVTERRRFIDLNCSGHNAATNEENLLIETCDTDPNRKSPNTKSHHLRRILRVALKVATMIYSFYRIVSRLIDLIKEVLG